MASLIVPRRQPGEHGGVAGREQPGQDLLGEPVVPGADEHALAGRPGGRRDSEQAGATPVGRIDPPHTQGSQLAAQPGVRLGREHQRNRHPVLPATCAVPPRLAPIEPVLPNVADGLPAALEEHARGPPRARPHAAAKRPAPVR